MRKMQCRYSGGDPFTGPTRPGSLPSAWQVEAGPFFSRLLLHRVGQRCASAGRPRREAEGGDALASTFVRQRVAAGCGVAHRGGCTLFWVSHPLCQALPCPALSLPGGERPHGSYVSHACRGCQECETIRADGGAQPGDPAEPHTQRVCHKEDKGLQLIVVELGV